MKRFRIGNTGPDWTRRSAIAAVLGAAACSNPPIPQLATGDHPLWPRKGPPVLRGAVIAQRRRRVEVDGATFGGGGPVLPAYQRADFNALADAGANLVVMSFPELWTVDGPWRGDQQMADVLGRQLDDARGAGLYVVLALRSGPGRSDFIFHREAAGSWFPKALIVDAIWRERDAQAAWGEMCVDAARLVKGRSELAGLNIMVEPDPNVGGLNKEGGPLGAWTPEEYSAEVSEVSDWRRIAGDVARKVRGASADLPILISPPAFARTDFLPVMGPAPVNGLVWSIHDYEPREFTHVPEPSAGIAVFSEGGDQTFAQRVDRVQADAPVFLGEFGASRWASGVDDYYSARIAACELRSMAWAAFRWPTSDKTYEAADDMFNVLLDGRAAEPAAIDVLRPAWKQTHGRPAGARLRGRS
ncbi:MAG: cellulase family glycosylhydrolase [Hyphomonadaceae bacterium]